MANVPAYPALFNMPFAANGDKVTIPDTTTALGKASWNTGFPPETSKPLEQDGIPPARTDFNGILNLISTWAFYKQSGGIAIYNSGLNYVVPAMVYYSGIIYTCVANNGPNLGGAKVPGASGSQAYWRPGLGDIAVNTFGNNANLYVKQGVYWIDSVQATYGFPRAGVAGWLTVLNRSNVTHQSFACYDSYKSIYDRFTTNGSSWSGWVKVIFQDDIRDAAYHQIYYSTAAPNNATGQNGDVWFTYI